MKIYEKPKLHFVDIVNPENIANTCWGGATESLADSSKSDKGQNLVWRYYGGVFDNDRLDDKDISDGQTYIDFRVGTTNCARADSSTIKIQQTSVGDETRRQQLLNHLAEIYNAGNGGSNWKGENSITPIIGSK